MLTKSITTALACCAAIGFSSVNADAALHHPHHYVHRYAHHYVSAAHNYSRCDDMGFARVGDGWVADPVCQSELAAHIAHKSGYHYSAAELYSNPAAMDEFCRGEDNIELTTTCAPYND